MCVAPPHAAGTIWVDVALNGQDPVGLYNRFFSYFVMPVLMSLFPSGGPIQGDTVVDIEGDDFQVNIDRLLCRYSNRRYVQVVDAVIVNERTLRCTAPPFPEAGMVNMDVTFNDQDFNAPLRYAYYIQPNITDFSPQGGPFSGYTRIDYFGVGFAGLGDNIGTVRFVPQNGPLKPTDTVQCSDYEGSTGMQDSFDAAMPQYSVSKRTCTVYDPLCFIPDKDIYEKFHGATPSNVCGYWSRFAVMFDGYSDGPYGGRYLTTKPLDLLRGAIVSFKIKHGSHVIDRSDDLSVDENGNRHTLYCERPEIGDELRLQLQKRSDGDKWFDLPGGVFEAGNYYNWTTVKIVIPPAKNQLGSQLRFAQLRHAQGNYDNWAVDDIRIALYGGYLSDKQYACVSPKIDVPAGSKTEDRTIEFLLNSQNQVVVGVAPYQFYSHPNVNSVWPRGGPFEGSTMITIFGAGFSVFRKPIPQCKLGPSLIAEASIVSDSSVVCFTPSTQFADIAAVEVSLNGFDFTDYKTANREKVSYQYYPKPTLSWVWPRAGPYEGGASVTVIGTGFADVNMSVFCRWRSKLPNVLLDGRNSSSRILSYGGERVTAVDEKGLRINSTHVKCVAPKFTFDGNGMPYLNLTKNNFSEIATGTPELPC